MSAEKRISKAKSKLVLRHPFIGCIALGLPTHVTNDQIDCPTAYVDGSKIVFNEDWVGTLNDDNLLFVMAHECMHPMLEHNYREGTRDPDTWNDACDYIINYLLTQEKIGVMPEYGLLDKKLYTDSGGTAEKIYDILAVRKKNQPSNGGNEGVGTIVKRALDDCRSAARTKDKSGQVKSRAQVAEEQQQWKVRVAQAAQAARTQGKLSAGLSRLVDDLLRTPVDWEGAFDRWVQRAKVDERSFARMNRRFITQGLYLPSRTGEELGPMAVAIDCSGSVSNRELQKFKNKVRSIWEDMCPSQLTVLCFDTKVLNKQVFKKGDTLDIKLMGGGGTAFSPVFEELNKTEQEFIGCVVITDMACDDFGPEPEYPVLWVDTYGGGTAPWGEIIKMTD